VDPFLRKVLLESGLSPEVVDRHRQNINSFLAHSDGRFFPIADTCRLDNSGVLSLPEDPGEQSDVNIVAFIPAAGASTRYVAPLADLLNALESGSRERCLEALKSLRQGGFTESPLPRSLKNLFLAEQQGNFKDFSTLAAEVLRDLSAPKALYPAVHSGETFLELKRHEHQRTPGLFGEVYITPPHQAETFRKVSERVNSPLPARFYEQGLELSTVRFDRDGQYVLDEHSRPSFVPNGHGALIRLFSRVGKDFPGANAVFIRNIDNISGASEIVRLATARFLTAFKRSLLKLKDLRAAVKAGNSRVVEAIALDLMKFWGLKPSSSTDSLTTMMMSLFHTSPSSSEDIQDLLDRPFVLMGQVPNTGRDVGGSCVFATIDGIKQKICLELPHASKADKQHFLENPQKATHFNPVFVAAELPQDDVIDRMENNPFWLISKKTWKGKDVYYQESILYELLGSSQFTNVIFVEVPRLVFNPHKTILDAKNKQFSDWIQG
jgi:hypothetical protein